MNNGECVNTDTDGDYSCECQVYRGEQCEEEKSRIVWTPPFGWTGPDPVLYRSFDNMDGLMLMEGTERKNSSTLVPGQVRKFTYWVYKAGVQIS